MSEYKQVKTSAHIWAAIHARHPEMVVFGQYSAPDGGEFSNPDEGKMFTSYGFKDSDYPIIAIQTTWDINPEKRHHRLNERHEYWLCLPIKE